MLLTSFGSLQLEIDPTRFAYLLDFVSATVGLVALVGAFVPVITRRPGVRRRLLLTGMICLVIFAVLVAASIKVTPPVAAKVASSPTATASVAAKSTPSPHPSGSHSGSGSTSTGGNPTGSGGNAGAKPTATPTPSSSYRNTILADQPVLYYRLGDSPGSTVAQDASGNGHTGSYSGGVTLGQSSAIVGDKDTSASFDGSTGIVDSRTNVLSPSSTIEAWVNPTTLQGCFGLGCSAGEEVIAGTGGAFQLTYGRVPGTVRVWLWPSDNTDWHYLDASTSIPLNTWSYVTTTWDNATKQLSIYINGALSASLSLPGVTSSYQTFNQLPFTFNLAGFQPGSQQPYQGGLDEVAYYNHALSANRILAHYRAGTTPGTASAFIQQPSATSQVGQPFAMEPLVAVQGTRWLAGVP
jgi:hypothetical protein